MRSVSSTNSLVLTEITLSRYCLRTYYRVSTQIPYYHFAIFLLTLECQHFANRPFARYEVYLRPEFISSLSYIFFKIWYSQWGLSNKSPNLNKETKPWGILVVIVKWRHCANGLWDTFILMCPAHFSLNTWRLSAIHYRESLNVGSLISTYPSIMDV